jgi:sugar lactone lactonase YvrE
MRKLLLVLVAAGALTAPTALAQGSFPEKIALPNAFAPEGIEIVGNTFFVGSVQTGAIYAGNLRSGKGKIRVAGATTAGTRGATGIEWDRGNLWVAGAGYGTARVYNAKSGALMREFQLAQPPATFINDVVVTKQVAYFTDSQQPAIYAVVLGTGGAPTAVRTIPLLGDYQHLAGQFNLNGIVATPDGKTLIAVQSAAKKLFAIHPVTGVAKLIDTGTYDLANGDGLLLQGKTLYVVQNRSNKVAVFQLSKDLGKATFVKALTDPDFDVPTTIDRAGKRLYAVNARFGTATADDQSYHVVKVG